MSREKAETLGCVYWEDFFKGTRGNHWRVEPTSSMVSGVEIYQLERTPCLRDDEGNAHGWGEKEKCQVLFDRDYALAYAEKYKKLFSVLSLLEAKEAVSLVDKFKEFEQSTGLVVSSTNPRQTTYLKFKEYCNDNFRGRRS